MTSVAKALEYSTYSVFYIWKKKQKHVPNLARINAPSKRKRGVKKIAYCCIPRNLAMVAKDHPAGSCARSEPLVSAPQRHSWPADGAVEFEARHRRSPSVPTWRRLICSRVFEKSRTLSLEAISSCNCNWTGARPTRRWSGCTWASGEAHANGGGMQSPKKKKSPRPMWK